MNAAHPRAEELKAVEKRMYTALLTAGGTAFFGVITFVELRQLESGERESVLTFTWIITLYEMFGVTGPMVMIFLITLLAGAAGIEAMRSRRQIISDMGAVAHRALVRHEASQPGAIQFATDAEGRVPVGVFVWGGVLVALIAAVFVGVRTGLIR